MRQKFAAPNAAIGQQELFQRAAVLHQKGQLVEARALYEEILNIHPRHFDALHLLGIIAYQTDYFQIAIEFFDRAIEANPHISAVYSNRGLALQRLKRFENALESYDKAIALDSDYVDAHLNRGNALQNLDQYATAIASYDTAIVLKNDYAEAYNQRGNAFRALKQYDVALANYDQAVALNPDDVGAHFNRANVLFDLTRYAAALASYDRVIALNPDHADALFNRGNALRELERKDLALASYEMAIARNKGHVGAYNNRGILLRELKQFDGALASYERVIALNPDHPDIHFNRGIALADLRQYAAALSSYDRALTLKPDHGGTHNNRGIALQALKQFDPAIASYDTALAIDPEHADAYFNRGNAFFDLKRYEAALADYEKALSLDPQYDFVRGACLHIKMQLCDWVNFDQALAQLINEIQRGQKAVPPFPALAFLESPSSQRIAAEIWLSESTPVGDILPRVPKYPRHPKIRVGYFSADFREHPVSRLTAGLYETHDRSRFEIIAFSFGQATQDDFRRRLEAGFDKFIDVNDKSDKEIAVLSRTMEIDIAVDLGGLTKDNRAQVFALRAAPLQVSYIGYLGTMGVDYMDYLIADKTLIPEHAQEHYAERIVYLPSYQVNDSRRCIPDLKFTRQQLGLPQTGFVFCCFNNTYKITPGTFDGWMRILAQVEGSVLFLYANNESSKSNLRKEAAVRGIRPERLVFGAHLPEREYLARYRVADLFLDTFPYNAGTTASDALWVGLPVLTRAGETFASRMGASLLNAVHLPELITTSQDAYEKAAVLLATHPTQLGKLRQKLEDTVYATPLFNTELFTRHLETAYGQIYERYQAGLPCEHVYVDGG